VKLFRCQNCGQGIFFESVKCLQCGFRLAYAPSYQEMLAQDPSGKGAWLGAEASLVLCANSVYGVCNWLTPLDQKYCLACRHNRTIPNLDGKRNIALWARLELAKRYLFYGLLRFDLKTDDDLHFDFLDGDQRPVTTGHSFGLITIDLAEADDAERERRRNRLGEPYRTLLGHFRHEIGHYYWDRLVATSTDRLTRFRETYGDETQDYAQALDAYYRDGPAHEWEDRFVTAYASAHPWEDFAETWAHYFHVVDTLETASEVNLRVKVFSANESKPIGFDPYDADSVDSLVAVWRAISMALNAINRSMGHPDLYPFVLVAGILPKLKFIHSLIQRPDK
jgi:hypothetical protein